jgi:hypothetical protein
MKKSFLLLTCLLFSLSAFSQAITSIYSFTVDNPKDIQTIVMEMTKHFESDFAKAGGAVVEIVDEHFNGSEKSNLSFVYKFKDVQEMQDEYARTGSSDEVRKVQEIILPLVKENSQMLLKSLVGGKGQGKTGVTMVFVMKVQNPVTYLNAYNEFISTMEENGKSKLFTEYGLSEIFAGGQNNLDATHHAVIGAVDMTSLVNGLDELFSSQEFRLFSSKVIGNREVLSRKTVFRLASFNE